MDFWTIMVITFGGGVFADEQSLIPYPSAKACGEAIEVVYETLHDPFPELVIQCVESDEPSRVLKPKRRPADLMGDAS